MNSNLCKSLAAAVAIAAAAAAHAGPTGAQPTPVTVMNGSSAAVPVKMTGMSVGEPFHRSITLNMAAADAQKIAWDTWAVPAGKRAVVEHVSAQCAGASATQMTASLIFNTSAVGTAGHYLAGVSRTFGTQGLFTTSTPLKLHMPAGSVLGMQTYKSETMSSAICFLGVSGYLIDAS